MMYGNRCAGGNRPPAHSPTDTAGLKCPPEIGPNAYAPVSTVSPNASETPRRPIPTPGKVAASTALPHPPSTSQNVPRNSAASFVVIIPPSTVERCAAQVFPPQRQRFRTRREVARSNAARFARRSGLIPPCALCERVRLLLLQPPSGFARTLVVGSTSS